MSSPGNPLLSQQKAGFFLPSPDLAGFVRYYWKMEDPDLNELHKKARISPSGYPELIFQFGDPVVIDIQNHAAGIVPRAMIAGQITQSISLDFRNSIHCFCVKLMPYALRAVFDMDSSEFTDQATDLGCIAPSVSPGLHDQLCCSQSDRERIIAIEAFLRSSLKKRHEYNHPASAHFVNQVHSHPDFPFRAIMDEMGGSHRTLERKIKHDIGLAPKKFHRIVRFNKAYASIRTNPGLRFQDVVFSYGYYDLSHFVNEFREFTGSAPYRYFKNGENFNQFFAGI